MIKVLSRATARLAVAVALSAELAVRITANDCDDALTIKSIGLNVNSYSWPPMNDK